MQTNQRSTKLGLLLRVGVFMFLSIVGIMLFGWLIDLIGGYFVAAVMATFAASAVATSFVLRIYESGNLSEVGLQWNPASACNLVLGVSGGIGAALLVLIPPLALGFARMRPDHENPASWPTMLFVVILLVFGAVGEELLFRGYGFQILWREIGPFATILPTAVLFGLLHSNNPDATTLSTLNTIGWGVVLGVAVLRSGDLWLAIGLHYGWNLVLPLFGVDVSGFKVVGATGYAMRWSIGDLWSGGAYGPEGGLLTSIVLVPLAVYLWRAPIRGQRLPLLSVHEEG